MGDEPNFISEFATAFLGTGLAIRRKAVVAPGQPGPDLEFWVGPEQATSFPQGVLEAVDEWKKAHRARTH